MNLFLFGIFPLLSFILLYERPQTDYRLPSYTTSRSNVQPHDTSTPKVISTYYDLYGKRLRDTVFPDGIARNLLVLTNDPAGQEQAIEDCNVIECPSNDVLDLMLKAYQLSDSNGREHGFFIGKYRNITRMVEGTYTSLDGKAKRPALNDLTEKKDTPIYAIHTHPLNNPEDPDPNHFGMDEPSKDDSLPGNFAGGIRIGIILGYIPGHLENQPNLYGGVDRRPPLDRSIGFYKVKGLFSRIKYDKFVTTVRKLNKQKNKN